MKPSPSLSLGVALLPALALAQTADMPSPPTNLVARPAIFNVTTDILNAGVEPFTSTSPGFGNSLKRAGKGGFEPLSFRNLYTVGQDSPDRVYVSSAGGLSNYDSNASGYLDGAEVRVYRVVNGAINLVRSDHVIEGGSVIEDWASAMSSGIIKPTETSALYAWEDWTRPGAERWYSVSTVNADGVRTHATRPVKLTFTKAPRGTKIDNNTFAFRAPATPRGVSTAASVENLRAEVGGDGVVRFTWDAPADTTGLVGYALHYTDTDPATHRGTYLQLSRRAATPEETIKTGDMVIVAKEMIPMRLEYFSNRMGGLTTTIANWLPAGVPNALVLDQDAWRLVPHAADTPVEDGGKTYFEMTVKSGESHKVGHHGIPDISTTSQNYYPVPAAAEYTMEVWMKADRADAPPVVFEYDGDRRVGGFLQPHPIQVGTTWKKYTHTFMGSPTAEGQHAYLVLTATGPATYSFDNFRVYRSDAAYLDYTPEEYARLKNSGMAAYRTHHPIKTKTSTYSMEQFTGPNGTVEGVAKGVSLGGVLNTIHQAGLRPWLQIEFHMSPEEWLGFAEFIAAPYDPAVDTPQTKPWAYKRHQQGRAEPWTDAFDRLYFEISNETWNRIFRPWVFGPMTDGATGKPVPRGAVYGLFHDYVVGILRTSPWWTEEIDAKFIHVMCGWAISSYNAEIASATRTGDFITVGAYNGGWDEGEGVPRQRPASYFNLLNFANQNTLPRSQALLARAVEWERDTGRRFGIGTYEAGPGYSLNGLNNARVTREQAAEQELVMKSKVAGVANLDAFLAMAANDFDLQNYFTFSEGDYFTSHARTHQGGHAHPSWLYLELFNREATGDMLLVKTQSTPTLDLPAYRRRQAIEGAPTVAAYATRDGDRVNVFLVSRRFAEFPAGEGDGHTPTGLQLPFTKADKITLHRATGAPEDHNLDGEKVRLESVPVSPAALGSDGRFVVGPDTGGDARGLPPAEVYLYVFEGTDIGAPGKALTREEITRLPLTFTGE